ncbi:hypothetical protein RJ55_00969 [Drechmeria coniospora]|nr:hypothetical protein RJ55_00969 [Drechmeria coniospora]
MVPLTVSPFVPLPTATTLSYNYQTMPSNIPPSPLGIPTAAEGTSSEQQQPRFIVSGSGHAASPSEIQQSCEQLLSYVTQLQKDAERELCQFEESIKERDLAEKRRLAPGWLDSDSRLLEPERPTQTQQVGHSAVTEAKEQLSTQEQAQLDEGAQLDKAFGGISLR